jgi:hypothetical protein
MNKNKSILNNTYMSKKLVSLIGLNLIWIPTIIAIPFVSANCGGGGKYEVIAHGNTSIEINTQICEYFAQTDGTIATLNSLNKTYNHILASNLQLTQYTSDTLAYTFSWDNTEQTHSGNDVENFHASDWKFVKRNNENSSLYSFCMRINNNEFSYVCKFDTYKTNHNIYVEYTGSGTL